MSQHTMFFLAVGGLFLLWTVLIATCLLPAADEVPPHLDAGYEGGGDREAPAALDPFETTLVVRSPYQFWCDGETGDWVFSEEWDDGSLHKIRVRFTTLSAQGTVTEWVGDALVAKTDAFLREHRG